MKMIHCSLPLYICVRKWAIVELVLLVYYASYHMSGKTIAWLKKIMFVSLKIILKMRKMIYIKSYTELTYHVLSSTTAVHLELCVTMIAMLFNILLTSFMSTTVWLWLHATTTLKTNVLFKPLSTGDNLFVSEQSKWWNLVRYVNEENPVQSDLSVNW